MSYSIPIGPYHVALEEPYKIELECEGENVIGSSIKVGFNFRGIEWLAQRTLRSPLRCWNAFAASVPMFTP
jgi:Ni,Fe-hydrogenase III large subunit